MLKIILAFGNFFRSAQGIWAFLIVVVPPIGAFSLGVYETIGISASIAMAMFTLACGVWLVIGVFEVYERFFPLSHPIPLLDLFKKSGGYGWNLSTQNYDILDLCHALEEMAVQGEIVFLGSLDSAVEQNIRTNPKVKIPQDYWNSHDIEWTPVFSMKSFNSIGDFIDDNFRLCTKSKGLTNNNEIYNDLHIAVGVSVGQVLKRSLVHRGRQQKIDEVRNRNFLRAEREFEKLL